MNKNRLYKVTMLIGALALTSPSYGAIVDWQLNGVTFSDGGIATGDFSFDSSTSLMVSFNISTSGGNTNNLPPTVYSSSNPNDHGSMSLFAPPYPNDAIGMRDVSQSTPLDPLGIDRILMMRFENTLSTPSAYNAIFTGVNQYGIHPSMECFDCSPYRIITGGYVSAVPIPAAIWLFGSAVVCLGITGRNRLNKPYA